MIPLRDVIPSRTFPGVTVALVALNVIAFVYQYTLSRPDQLAFLQAYGTVPADFSWPSAFASMFLHAGTLHLIGNVVALWIFGDNVEDRMGHGRYLGFYVLCGVVASLAHVATDPTSSVAAVGASGAVAGVMGAYFVLYPQSKVLTLVPLPVAWPIVEVRAVAFLGVWFVLQVFSGAGPFPVRGHTVGRIALWADVAGFAAGAVLVFLFRRPERIRVEWWDGAPTSRS